jgi:hypothetical protein
VPLLEGSHGSHSCRKSAQLSRVPCDPNKCRNGMPTRRGKGIGQFRNPLPCKNAGDSDRTCTTSKGHQALDLARLPFAHTLVTLGLRCKPYYFKGMLQDTISVALYTQWTRTGSIFPKSSPRESNSALPPVPSLRNIVSRRRTRILETSFELWKASGASTWLRLLQFFRMCVLGKASRDKARPHALLAGSKTLHAEQHIRDKKLCTQSPCRVSCPAPRAEQVGDGRSGKNEQNTDLGEATGPPQGASRLGGQACTTSACRPGARRPRCR